MEQFICMPKCYMLRADKFQRKPKKSGAVDILQLDGSRT